MKNYKIMKPSELKKLIIGSLDEGADPQDNARKIEEAGISYDFSRDFTEKVMDRVFSPVAGTTREVEFVRSLRFIFNRVALTGVAAIVLLLISIFLAEGSLSLDSFLGIGDSYDESMICLITGN